MHKIVFISHEPLTKYLYKLFYIQEIQSAGFITEYWDCSNIAWKGLSLPDTLDIPIIKKINTISEFSEEVVNSVPSQTIYSVELRRDIKNLLLFKILSDNNCYLIRFKLFENCVLPTSTTEIWQSIITGRIIKDIINRIHNSFKAISNKQAYKQENIKDYDLVFSSTPDCDIAINHPDYDNYIQSEMNSKDICHLERQKHIVYLDNYFPFHPDIIKNNPSISSINLVQHYKELNLIFDKIEKVYQSKIIIAAHPKADYTKNEFKGREIIKYHTQQLIAQASLVILHSSNAIAYAIAYNIPFMFISTTQYQKARTEYYRMRRLSSYFKSPIITTSNINKMLENWHNPSDYYIKKYLYTFLTKPNIEKTLNTQIIIPTLKQISK